MTTTMRCFDATSPGLGTARQRGPYRDTRHRTRATLHLGFHMSAPVHDNSRREFLKLLAASPALPYLNLPSDWTRAIRRLSGGAPDCARHAIVITCSTPS